MAKKILAIIMAALMIATFAACNATPEETTEDGIIDITTDETTGTETDTETETGTEAETGSNKAGDPGEYEYSTDKNGTVYVNNPGSAVTLRAEDYAACGSVAHGTALERVGISTDKDNYWSKVLYKEKVYYVATKFLTTMSDPDEGFALVTKTVVINEKTGAMNVRNIPSMEGTVIGHVVHSVEITVLAENTETGWYKIEFVNADKQKDIGYIASDSKYFVKDKTGTETGTENTETETGTEAAE
jgi:hypothetical protein